MKIVYILGISRTGSTMLDMVLGSHPDCMSLGECGLLDDKKRSVQRHCSYCGESCPKWKEFRKKYKKPHFYKTAFEVFGTPILIDSTKKWKWLKARMNYEDYEYKIIHLVRNGKDRLKMKKRLEGKIEPYVIQDWVNTYRKCEKICRRQKGITVRYEDIHKVTELRRICKFIGIDYRPEMREFWRQGHHGISGGKGAYAMVRQFHDRDTDHGEFLKNHGFNLKPRTGHEFLSKEDLRVFKQHGGERLNRRLGYE